LQLLAHMIRAVGETVENVFAVGIGGGDQFAFVDRGVVVVVEIDDPVLDADVGRIFDAVGIRIVLDNAPDRSVPFAGESFALQNKIVARAIEDVKAAGGSGRAVRRKAK